MNRIQQLEQEILSHNKNYYVDSKPTISDNEYDGLISELKALSPDSKVLQGVGEACYNTSIWKKIKHTTIIGSLDKVTSFSEILDWIRIKLTDTIKPIIIMHKYDGLTLVCTYVNGELTQALTRGDGFIGEDVTENALKIPSIACKSRYFSGTLRGEVVVTKENFKKHFKDDYANARNIASGVLKRSNSTDCKYLDIFFYEAIEGNLAITSRARYIDWINEFFPNKVWYSEWHMDTNRHDADISSIIAKEEARRPDLPYNIDGLVIRVDDIFNENKKRPDFARAYKFEAEQARTTIKEIAWKNTGKAISPVAILETVWLDGSNVSKASIHNVDWLTKKGIGIGSEVLISKRGDIIPQIETVITGGVPVDIPKVCPVCGMPTTMNNQFLVCADMNCPARNRRFIKKMFRVLDINFAGEKTIDLIADTFLVQDLINVFNNESALKKFETWLTTLPRMGAKSAHKIIVEIRNKRVINTMQAIWMLDIDNFSSSRIKKVIEAGFNTVNKIKNITPSEMSSIKGFKDMSSTIVKALRDARLILDSITDNFLISTPPKPTTSTLTANMDVLHFVLTGKLSVPRNEWAKNIVTNGHIMDKAITKNTDYLVAGDGTWGNKHKKAEKLGVKVISEQELNNIIN